MPVMPGSRFAPAQSTSQRILFVSTSLTLLLALFAFGLQWRGGELVDSARLGKLAGDNSRLPGVQQDALNSPLSGRFGTNSDCAKLQPPHVGMFPHYIGWQYAIQKHSSKVKIHSRFSHSFAQNRS